MHPLNNKDLTILFVNPSRRLQVATMRGEADAAPGQPFGFGSFTVGGRPELMVVRDDQAVAMAELFPSDAPTLDQLYQEFGAWSDRVAARLSEASAPWTCWELGSARIPLPVGTQVVCAGANYRQHVVELMMDQRIAEGDASTPEAIRQAATRAMDDRAANGQPYAFAKLPSALTAAGADISVPHGVTDLDWELELGVVIGRADAGAAAGDPLARVAGYTIANDITCRSRVMRDDLKALGTDWLMSKSLPGSTPVGPIVIPRRFVPDIGALRITLTLNGRLMQAGATADMVFGVPRLIDYLCGSIALQPGDLLLTGSPSGNGTHYGRFLEPGDVMVGSITGLGRQQNRITAPS